MPNKQNIESVKAIEEKLKNSANLVVTKYQGLTTPELNDLRAKLKPVHGFCAETAGAAMLIGTALTGIPVSTTHTITGAIMGVGATTRLSAVRWGVATRIVWAWILTIPASALVAAAIYKVLHLFL